MHATHVDQVLCARQDAVDATHVISRRIQAEAEMEGPASAPMGGLPQFTRLECDVDNVE